MFHQLDWRGYMNNVSMKVFNTSIMSVPQSWRRFNILVIAGFMQEGWTTKVTASPSRTVALARTQGRLIAQFLSHCLGRVHSRSLHGQRLSLLNIFAG